MKIPILFLLLAIAIASEPTAIFAQNDLTPKTDDVAQSPNFRMANLYFELADMHLDHYRVSGEHRADHFEEAIDSYEKGLRLQPDNAYYHNRLGYAYHLERRLKDASREYAKALELDPPHAVTAAEFELALKLAPRVYTQPNEFFGLADVVVIFHPQKPIIEYSFFWDDDVNFPADNDPTDHEKVWIEYDPHSGEVVAVYAYFHHAVLSTNEALEDARKHENRARFNIQWGGHGSLPVGWQTIPSEQNVIKYANLPTPYKVEDMQARYEEHRRSIRMPNHPLAKDWPKRFEGSWQDYITFTKYIDLPEMIDKKKMVMKSKWSNAVIDHYFLDYQFFPKMEWPADVP